MPRSVAEELKWHAEAFPCLEVELPWEKPEGRGRKYSLVLTTQFGNAIAVVGWNTNTWKPAPAEAGVIPPRPAGAKPWQWQAVPRDGFHVLRHTYASIMLEAGESVVTVARWLGHSSPTVTLVTTLISFRMPGGRDVPPSTDSWGDRLPVEAPQILPRADHGRSLRGAPGAPGAGLRCYPQLRWIVIVGRVMAASPVAGEAPTRLLSCDGDGGTVVVRVETVAFLASSVRRTP